ncbi:FAD binding domain-containing protein [Xylariales sp. PMI_506]|nr:FAD binding domain-containing protein [Xylariales sp. PMI_506]
MVKLLQLALQLAVAVTAAGAAGSSDLEGELAANTSLSAGCESLLNLFPTKLFLPGSAVYKYEAANFWSNTELMNPDCVFRPVSASDVSAAVLSSQSTQSPFAVRGGGHMGITGANNINNGVLMVMSNLTSIELSTDKTTLTLGPGFRWIDVYNFLEPYNLAVSGGRLAPVGVPGLLLAGGVNFYGNQYGWSADTVTEYEVVIANGTVVTATKDVNPDLFWALKGGSSNFGIVTSFTMTTHSSTNIYGGTYTVFDVDAFLEAVANFTTYNTDPRAHIVPMIIYPFPSIKIASVILFYDSPTDTKPACFEPFFNIFGINLAGLKTLAEFAEENGALVFEGINDMFIAGTVVGKTYEAVLRGLQITEQVYANAISDLYKAVPLTTLRLVSLDWQPITSLWQAGSQKSNPVGSPLNVLDPSSNGNYLAYAQVVEWASGEYDDAVLSWVQNTTTAITDATKAAGLYNPFLYMGDAAGFEDVFAGYGTENQQKLLDISRKYDPDRVFQKLLPGGFKIGV